MGYRKAEDILPLEIIELIQQYVDGESIYIPRNKNNRRKWGQSTRIKVELEERNLLILTEYQNGVRVSELAERYFLSDKSIQRIIRKSRM